MSEDRRDNKDWLQIFYQVAHSDIQWAKGQSWNATQWTLLLFGAVFVASRHLDRSGYWWLVGFVAVIGLGACVWLWQLHLFAAEARNTSERILGVLPERATYLPPRLSSDPDHLYLLGYRWIVIVAAAVITSLAILSQDSVMAK